MEAQQISDCIDQTPVPCASTRQLCPELLALCRLNCRVKFTRATGRCGDLRLERASQSGRRADFCVVDGRHGTQLWLAGHRPHTLLG